MRKLIFTLLALSAASGTFAIGPIAGPIDYFCVGGAYTFTDATSGGRWYSLDTTTATIDSITGFARIVGTGTSWETRIAYCIGADSAFYRGDIYPQQLMMNGPSTLCAGSSIDLVVSPIYGYAFMGYLRTWSSNVPGVAVTGASGWETTVTGISPGTAVITYNRSAICPVTTTITVTPSSCIGTPAGGTASFISTGLCVGSADTLKLSAYTACGTAQQWQSSPDGSSWSNLPGLICAKNHYSPLGTAYYRCKTTCIASSSSSYSNTIYIPHHDLITTHSAVAVDSSCSTVSFCLHACDISSTLNATAYFGDGASQNLSVAGSGTCNADFVHTYLMPGTYTVKEILYQDATPLDSTSFSYNYVPCVVFPVNFYFDSNANCVFDSYERLNSRPTVTEVDSNGIPVDTISATSGFSYKGYGPSGTVYTFRVLSAPVGTPVTCPSSGIIRDTILAGVSHYTPKYFGLNCSGGAAVDLDISSSLICGRHMASGTIIAGNNYCMPADATVTMYFSPQYVFASASPVPASVVGNKVTWYLHDLSGADEPVVINYYLEIPIPDVHLWLTPGDTIHSDISISPFVGDIDTTNNRNIAIDTVKISWDPNSMAVSPAGNILPCTPLQYTVHFENTGNDTAHNIHIQDTLSDYADVNSLKIVATSAKVMNVSFSKAGGHNVAKFDFPGIKLLDSTYHNLCDGMVIFTIKSKNGLADGANIDNRAGIYFDDNAVVMTNGVTNLIGMQPITGPASICGGGQILLVCATQDGVWHSSNASATIDGSGLVTGIAMGTDTISYTVSNTCTSLTRTKIIGINSLAPSVQVALSVPHDTICAGTSVTFTAVTLNGGLAPAYQWKINGTVVDTTASYAYLPANADVVMVTLAGAVCGGVPSTDSNSVTMTVLPTVTPAVSINTTPAADTICAGTSVTFSAVPGAGGAGAVYEWLVNGAVASATGTFSYTPANRDAVTLKLTSDYECASPATASATDTMTVNPLLIPGVIIASLPASDTVCAGTSIAFIATGTNGGMAPAYSWQVNGADKATGSSYNYEPANADMVRVIMTSNARCLTSAIATSSVNIAVNTPLQPSVSIAAQNGLPLIAGMSETLTANVTNGGASPAYQWTLNGATLPGATSASYTTGSLSGSDTVSCTITSSGECGGLTASATVVVLVVNAASPAMTPNPNKGIFSLTGTIGTATGTEQVSFDVKDAVGQVVYKSAFTVKNSLLNATVQLPPAIARGVYVLTLYTREGTHVLHFAVQ